MLEARYTIPPIPTKSAAMYDIKWIREYPDTFDGGLTRRGLEALSAKLLSLDEKRRAAITKFEQAQARRNAASKEIGEAKKSKDEQRANVLMAEVATLKTTLPALEEEQKNLAAELDKELAQIPNTPADDVPVGTDACGNVERHASGKKRDYAFKPKQHFELGEARAGQLRRQLEIHHAERFAQFEMLLGLERIGALLAVRVTLDIAARVEPDRHVVGRQIGDLRQFLVELFAELLLLGFQRRQRHLQRGDFGH